MDINGLMLKNKKKLINKKETHKQKETHKNKKKLSKYRLNNLNTTSLE